MERYEQQLSSDHENRTRTLFMAVSTEAAVLQSVLTANSGRNNRNENMKYGAYSNDLHEKCSCIPQEAPWKGTNSSCLLNHENRMRTLFMAVSTDAAVLLSVLTANPGRNNRSENMNTVHTAITL